jgi:aminopeptidase
MRKSIVGAAQMEEALNALQNETPHITGKNVDLHLELTPEARFRCSCGGNIPSFECFVTPDARKTSGWIHFTYPLLYEGNNIEGLRVEFFDGEVTNWSATKGSETFEGLLSLPGMNRLGEFALTDKRLSRIDTVIPGAPVLLENIGGTAQVAFGRGYKKCFADPQDTPHRNQSAEHCDVVLDGEFTVVAKTATDEEVVIFSDGICPLI